MGRGTSKGVQSKMKQPSDQICTHRDSNMNGIDLWSNMLLIDHAGTPACRRKRVLVYSLDIPCLLKLGVSYIE